MTTPDKEEMPRTAGNFWAEKRDGRWQLQMRHRGPGSSFCVAQINHWADNPEALTTRIADACNAYEPMRKALILAEKADRIHSKCQECEDGAQAPEACGDCFPSADDARVARRNVLKSLGVRMRDVDRARAIKAEPSICNCSQEDVHDYGPCGEHCRSQLATDPHDEDLSRLKDALQLADGAFESIRKKLVNNLDEPERSAFWAAVNARDSIRAALSTLPVNDRHHSGSDSYQADAGAPALSEKVITAAEWLPIESAPKDGRSILIGGGSYSYSGETFPEDRPFEQVAKAAYVDGEWFGGFGSEYDEKYSHSPTHWMPLPSPPGAEVTISNDAERDAVSLKPDTSSQPASEAGKLSTDEVL